MQSPCRLPHSSRSRPPHSQLRSHVHRRSRRNCPFPQLRSLEMLLGPLHPGRAPSRVCISIFLNLHAVGNVFRLRHFPPKHIRSAFRRLEGNFALQNPALFAEYGHPALALAVPAVAATLLRGDPVRSGAIYRIRQALLVLRW